MHPCPRCQQYPQWKYAHCTSAKTKVRTWSLSPDCDHCRPFMARAILVPQPRIPEIEAQWDAFAEELFVAYTAAWTEAERATFRLRWLNPHPFAPLLDQMTIEEIAATKKFCETTKAEELDNEDDANPFGEYHAS